MFTVFDHWKMQCQMLLSFPSMKQLKISALLENTKTLLHNCYSSVYSSTIGLMSSHGDVSIAKTYNIHVTYSATLQWHHPLDEAAAADVAAPSTVQKSSQKLLEVGMLGSRLVARGCMNGSIEPPWVTDCHKASKLTRDAAFCVQWTVWLVYMYVYDVSQYICIDAPDCLSCKHFTIYLIQSLFFLCSVHLL